MLLTPTSNCLKPCGPERLPYSHIHRVKLVVSRHLLNQQPVARVLKHNEISDQIEKTAFLEQALDDYLQLRQMRIG